jgi:hypothetical protein
MEEYDKTYMWLVLITFLALVVACVFSFMELNELQQPVKSIDPFAGS